MLMEKETGQAERRCYGCQRPLPDGVRFCVACGTHNFDPDSPRLAIAASKIKTYKNRTFVECFTHWWRYLLGGIRR